MSQGPKISFCDKKIRVRLTVPTSYIQKYPAPPEGIVDQAQAKIESERSKLNLKFVVGLEDDLLENWSLVRGNLGGGSDAETVSFDLALGCPEPKGYQCLLIEDGRIKFVCHEDDLEAFAGSFQQFKLWIKESAKGLGYDSNFHEGFLSYLFSFVKKGEEIEAVLPEAMPSSSKAKRLIANKSLQRVFIEINDSKFFKSSESLNELMRFLHKSGSRLKQSQGMNYELCKEFVVEHLRWLKGSGAAYGCNLPVQFVAFEIKPIEKVAALAKGSSAAEAKEAKSSPDKPIQNASEGETKGGKNDLENYPGRGLLKISVSEDKMEASVGEWDMDNYEIEGITFDADWLNKEIARQKIVFGVMEREKSELINRARKKESLDGCVIAVGREGTPPSSPFIHPSFKDRSDNEGDKDVNVRESQDRIVVEKDALVGVLKYEEEAEPNCNVFGEETAPEMDGEVEVELGEGVKEKNPGEYYALYNGMPVIEDLKISVGRILIHDGDVNLRSGNIYFDGPIQVTGSIDNGCVVECSGDLFVGGSVRGGQIRVGGSIEVTRGVITGKEGNIRCKGNLRCDFIENSRVMIAGNVITSKSIMNSSVFCGGGIIADEQNGRITGGRLCVDHSIECASLGSENGNRTEVDVGRDWRSELAMEIRSNRYEALKAVQTEQKKELNTLKGRTQAQMTKKHTELKDKLQLRVNKLARLVPKAKDHLTLAKESVELNPNAKIVVHGMLSLGCVIRVAEAKVRLKDPVIEVMVTNKKKKGTYIHAIDPDELARFRAERDEGSKPTAKNEDGGLDSDSSDDENEQNTDENVEKAS